MEAASASAMSTKKFGYLPIPPVENKEHWDEVKQILLEAEPTALYKLHMVIHNTMKERNIAIPVIDGK